jgi:hypothetical protein
MHVWLCGVPVPGAMPGARPQSAIARTRSPVPCETQGVRGRVGAMRCVRAVGPRTHLVYKCLGLASYTVCECPVASHAVACIVGS